MNERVLPAKRTTEVTFEEIKAYVGREDPCIVEIGANNGAHTRKFLETFPACEIFCFEPDERAIAAWRRHIKDPRATLIPSAVGSTNEDVTFHVSGGLESEQRPGGYDKSGSIRAPKEHLEKYPFVTFNKTVSVPCMTLDAFVKSKYLTRIDFIWADVQGAEVDLIEGAQEALAITRFFYTEYSNRKLYEGQIDLDTMIGMLPNFEVLEILPMDVLFGSKSRESFA